MWESYVTNGRESWSLHLFVLSPAKSSLSLFLKSAILVFFYFLVCIALTPQCYPWYGLSSSHRRHGDDSEQNLDLQVVSAAVDWMGIGFPCLQNCVRLGVLINHLTFQISFVLDRCVLLSWL